MDRKIAVSYSIHLFRNQAFADGQRFGCKGGVQQAWLRIVSCAKPPDDVRFAAEGCLRARALAQNTTIMSSPPHPRLRNKQVATKESSGRGREIAVSY